MEAAVHTSQQNLQIAMCHENDAAVLLNITIGRKAIMEES